MRIDRWFASSFKASSYTPPSCDFGSIKKDGLLRTILVAAGALGASIIPGAIVGVIVGVVGVFGYLKCNPRE